MVSLFNVIDLLLLICAESKQKDDTTEESLLSVPMESEYYNKFLNEHSVNGKYVEDHSFHKINDSPLLCNSDDTLDSLCNNTEAKNINEGFKLVSSTSKNKRIFEKPLSYERRSPFPAPIYQNNYPQVSKYRNTRKNQNINQVMNFITENMRQNKYEQQKNSNNVVKFTGVYLNLPKDSSALYATKLSRHKRIKDVTGLPSDVSLVSTINGHAYNMDPLFPFKPRQPGDINLLAVKKFRFSPNIAQNRHNNFNRKKLPTKNKMFYRQSANSNDCQESQHYYNSDPTNEPDYYESDQQISSPIGKDKKRPLSVMLDVYPMDNEDEETMTLTEHLKKPIILPTTETPVITTKPQYNYYYPNNNFNQHYMNNEVYYSRNPISSYYPSTNSMNHPWFVKGGNTQIVSNENDYNTNNFPNKVQSSDNKNAPIQMLVHLNVYPNKKVY